MSQKLKRHNADLTKLTEELQTARAFIEKLTKDLNAEKAREQEMEMAIEEDELEDEDELPEVLAYDVYMCSACVYEVVDGYCQGRGYGLQHA
jgi:type II secretory pathway component PulJ